MAALNDSILTSEENLFPEAEQCRKIIDCLVKQSKEAGLMCLLFS